MEMLVAYGALAVSGLCGLFFSLPVGPGKLIYYTTLSNLFCLIVSALAFGFAVRRRVKKAPIPQWIHTLRYLSAATLTVTFVIVAFVFMPMLAAAGVNGWNAMYSGALFFNHGLTPVLCVLFYILLEPGKRVGVRQAALATVPTWIYGTIMMILNALRVVDGPYPFFRVHQQSLPASVCWYFGILTGAFLLAWLIGALRERFRRRRT